MASTSFYDIVLIHEGFTNIRNFIRLTQLKNPKQKFIILGDPETPNSEFEYEQEGVKAYVNDPFKSMMTIKNEIKDMAHLDDLHYREI